jgi:hypothetical protein
MTTLAQPDREPGPSIDVTEDGSIVLVIGEARVEVADPYAFRRALNAAIERRIEIRAPHAEHLGPVAGDDLPAPRGPGRRTPARAVRA